MLDCIVETKAMVDGMSVLQAGGQLATPPHRGLGGDFPMISFQGQDLNL